MSREIIANMNRREELLLELISDRFAAHYWDQVTPPESYETGREEFFRGWVAAWDDANQALADIIANYNEGNEFKMERWK
jgi:hypothetical protein